MALSREPLCPAQTHFRRVLMSPITFPRASVYVAVSECELSAGLCAAATRVGSQESLSAISERARIRAPVFICSNHRRASVFVRSQAGLIHEYPPDKPGDKWSFPGPVNTVCHQSGINGAASSSTSTRSENGRRTSRGAVPVCR